MTNQQLKNTYQLYTSLWKLVHEFHNAEQDKQWQQCTDRAEELVKQYGEECRSLILDTLELIERGAK